MSENTTTESAAIARVVEISAEETVTYTMPRSVYDMAIRIIDAWPLMYGLGRKVTVEYVLDLLEKHVNSDIRTSITVEHRANESRGMEGAELSFIWYDELPLDPVLPTPE